MTWTTAVFYYLASACVVSSLIAVSRKNPVHAMLWVLALFLHIAGIFLLLGSEFLAAVQVIVYAGAILIFYIFVIMLLDLPNEESQPRYGRHWPLAAVLAVSFVASLAALAGLSNGLAPAGEPPSNSLQQGSLKSIGTVLFGEFVLPFEMASVLLLAAIVGAVVLSRRRAAAK